VMVSLVRWVVMHRLERTLSRLVVP